MKLHKDYTHLTFFRLPIKLVKKPCYFTSSFNLFTTFSPLKELEVLLYIGLDTPLYKLTPNPIFSTKNIYINNYIYKNMYRE